MARTAEPASNVKGWVLTAEQLGPVSAERPSVVSAMRRAAHHAVLVHEETLEECSNEGGSHVLFKLVEAQTIEPTSHARQLAPQTGVIHFGGHGAHLANVFTKGQIWVASYEPLPAKKSLKNEVWCVPERLIDGTALAMLPAESREQASRLLDELSKP